MPSHRAQRGRHRAPDQPAALRGRHRIAGTQPATPLPAAGSAGRHRLPEPAGVSPALTRASQLPSRASQVPSRASVLPPQANPALARVRTSSRRPGRRTMRSGALVGTLSAATMIAVVQAPAAEQPDAHASALGPAANTQPVNEADLARSVSAAARLDRIAAANAQANRIAAQRAADAARATRDALRDPASAARLLAASLYGWGDDQWGCLNQLWIRESGWNYRAENASSGAYGIPQALPPEKMATAGPDWRDNPVTQIRWGLAYLARNYGSPCSAWDHETGYGWY